jgi:hypothetical protein
MLGWTIKALSTNLKSMLTNCGGAHLADEVDLTLVAKVTEEVDAEVRRAKVVAHPSDLGASAPS